MHPDIAYHIIQQTREERRQEAARLRLADSLPRPERSWRLGTYRLILRREGHGAPSPV